LFIPLDSFDYCFLFFFILFLIFFFFGMHEAVPTAVRLASPYPAGGLCP
jgi:hypothetical protein